jgi:CubicO group peptidase (beta-lactamase class C family)
LPVLALLLPLSPAILAANLETTVEAVVYRHMAEKQIPGMSVAIVQDGIVVFSAGYGQASLEFDVPATPDTVYPISSVSKIIAGLLAVRLAADGKLDLDASLGQFFDDLPADKRGITVRHLLQHTHGLEDFYRSDQYELDTGNSAKTSTADDIARWSLNRPAEFPPGSNWQYSLTGYVLLARVLEMSGGMDYEALVEQYVLEPTGIAGHFGGSEVLVPGRNPVLYELVNDELVAHIIDFPRLTWSAGGFNTSAVKLARLFQHLSRDEFINGEMKQELWARPTLANGELAHYALGWFSYRTLEDRWVVGHEGGGASWVIYYPELDFAVIALSNMSGARADSLPYEIAREAFARDLLKSD